MKSRTFLLFFNFLLSLLIFGHASGMEMIVYRANGDLAQEFDIIGGLCLVRMESAYNETVTDLHIRANDTELEQLNEVDGYFFWLPCQAFQENVLIRAEWRDRAGRRQESRKRMRIDNILLKIRLEVPESTPETRTIYAAGNLFGLGMKPEGEWDPRFFSLRHIGRGHWFGSLPVGSGESVELEFTMGGWGTKGRDKNNRVVHVSQTMPCALEIATRIHSWGQRIGQPDPRAPHLSVGDPLGKDVIISFRPDRELTSIRFGETEDDLSTKRVSFDRGCAFVRMKNLKPGTRYFYQIQRDDPIMTFQMPRTSELTFHVIGDSKGTPDVLNTMYQHGVSHLVIDTGDLVYSGWDEDNWDKSLNAISVLAARSAYMVVPGNHEEESPIFKEVFHFPHEEFYYAFHYGPARFLMLDSERPYETGSPQREFADSVLSSWRIQPDVPSFVALHAPPYSSGKHGSDVHIRAELCPLFEQAGVDIVFSGHDHGYEATWPLAGSVRNDGGTVYVVCAGGGAALYDTREPRQPWSRIREKTHHWITVHVRGKRISVRVFSSDGQLIDQFNSNDSTFRISEE